MITNKKTFTIGMVMIVSFGLIFALIMSPLFGQGRNGLEYADDTFNSLSKGSAYFIDEETEKVQAIAGTQFDVQLSAKTEEEAQLWANIYSINGAQVDTFGREVVVSGDLGLILGGILADSEAMYHNNGQVVGAKYGAQEQLAFYGVYNSLRSMVAAFDKQENFALTRAVQSVIQKAVEPGYNYYGIEAKKVANYKGTVLFLMVFYLIYTIWFGFGIYYLFDGIGITTSKSSKKAEA